MRLTTFCATRARYRDARAGDRGALVRDDDRSARGASRSKWRSSTSIRSATPAGPTSTIRDARRVEKVFGAQVKTTFVESVPATAGRRARHPPARRGRQSAHLHDLLRLHGADAEGGEAVSQDALRAQHRLQGRRERGDRTRRASTKGAYLLGVVAGKMTKSNTLGYVGSFPIPEVIRNIDAFTLGARSVNPAVKVKVIWVDTWYDPGKERQAAETLIAQGADVLCQNTDSPAVVQTAEKKGVYAFGWDSDMSKYGPRAQLTANTQNWGVYYVDEVRKALNNTWTGNRQTKWGIKENMVVLAPLSKAVPADVAKLFEERKQALAAGKLDPVHRPDQGQCRQSARGRGRGPAVQRRDVDQLVRRRRRRGRSEIAPVHVPSLIAHGAAACARDLHEHAGDRSYLPAVPALQKSLGVDVPAAQATIAVFFAGLALSQLAWGESLNRLGPRRCIVIGVSGAGADERGVCARELVALASPISVHPGAGCRRGDHRGTERRAFNLRRETMR